MSTQRVELALDEVAYLPLLDVELVAHIFVLRPLVNLRRPC